MPQGKTQTELKTEQGIVKCLLPLVSKMFLAQGEEMTKTLNQLLQNLCKSQVCVFNLRFVYYWEGGEGENK